MNSSVDSDKRGGSASRKKLPALSIVRGLQFSPDLFIIPFNVENSAPPSVLPPCLDNDVHG